MEKQTWQERIAEMHRDTITIVSTLHDRVERYDKEATERHQAIMEDHRAFLEESRANTKEILARVARLNGKDAS